MAVRDGHSGCGWDVELEDCHRTSRRLALQQESDRQLPNPDFFARAHSYLLTGLIDRHGLLLLSSIVVRMAYYNNT
jgi:hypothetical protein